MMFNTILLREFNQKAAAPKNKPKEILDSLGLQNGMTVADIGSGGGYFTLEFAKRVGTDGLVYAIDTNAKNLKFVKNKASNEGLTNIVPKLTGANGLDLAANSVDLFFLRNVFHHLTNPQEYCAQLKPILKSGGTIAIIDYKQPPARKSLSFIGVLKHFATAEMIRTTMATAGYRVKQNHDFLPEQSFTMFSL
jgi:ubiquinone/menaquinone biosynthesis C-methylase UbiE